MVRFSSYSWALVRHWVLLVSHGDARRHGCFYGILMESGKSVAAQRGNETRAARTIQFWPAAVVADSFHQSHVCQIRDSDQGRFRLSFRTSISRLLKS